MKVDRRIIRTIGRILLFGMASLGLSGCSEDNVSGGALSSPSVSPTGLPEDVRLCGFLSPSEAEKALEFTITQVSYSHRPGSGGGVDPATASLFCDIFSSVAEDPHVNVLYEPGGIIDSVIAVAPSELPPVFDDAKALESAEEFSIEGVEGEGLTLISERQSVAMWHYPDDHVLIVEMKFVGPVEAIDRRPQAKALVEASVKGVVEQASKPEQELTGYPPDSAAPGIEYATPNEVASTPRRTAGTG